MKVDIRVTFALLGDILLLFPLVFIPPLLIAIYTSENTSPFIIPLVVSLTLGLSLRSLTYGREIGVREAFLLVSITWLIVSALGALPYIIAGEGVLGNPVNALFESMSGFTTTGATVIENFDKYSQSIMFWRQLTQWLGGMGIIVLALAILPRLSIGGAQLMQLEAPGPQLQKLTPHIRRTAGIFWSIYIGLTLLETLVLSILHYLGLAPRMDPYTALIHAFTTMSTGGFSPYPQSIGAFSPIVQWIIIVFMVLAGTNFALFWYMLNKDLRIFSNEEFRWYIIVMITLSLIIVPQLASIHGYDLLSSLRHSLFQVVSITTTTGYATVDFSKWPRMAQYVLFFVMFIGGCSGSTAGSIKVIRWIIAIKTVLRELFVSVHNDAVKVIRLGGKIVEERSVRGVLVFITLYFLVFLAATMIIMIDSAFNGNQLTIIDSMTAVAATLGNIGPGLGAVGPMNNYLFFPLISKILMIGLMWLGRLEIITVLVLFTRSYWCG